MCCVQQSERSLHHEHLNMRQHETVGKQQVKTKQQEQRTSPLFSLRGMQQSRLTLDPGTNENKPN